MTNIKTNLILTSPLEQFTVFNFFNFFSIQNIKLTNLAVNFVFVVFIIFFLMYTFDYKIYSTNRKITFFNTLYKFIQNIFKENVSTKVPYFFPYIFFRILDYIIFKFSRPNTIFLHHN